MIIPTQSKETKTIDTPWSMTSVILRVVFCGFFVLASASLMAQVEQESAQATEQESTQAAPGPEQIPVEETTRLTVTLPTSQQMALAVATPESRRQALLDLAAAAHVVTLAQTGLANGVEVDQAALVQNYLDDRAWLQMLTERFGWVAPHRSVLDPAVWLLSRKLQQNDLENLPMLLPGDMPEAVLIYQVFQRAGQPLAVVNLPNLLLEVEADVLTLWDTFLRLAEVDGLPDAAWKAVETAWFTDMPKPGPEAIEESDAPVAEVASVEPLRLVDDFPLAMSNIVLSAVDARPPDIRALIQLRYSIVNALPELAGPENMSARKQTGDVLYLASLVDGLHEGRYFEFVQGVLSVTSRLLELPVEEQEAISLADWLVAELPSISAHYSANFAAVDPRLNSAMVAIYDVLVTISGFQPEVVVNQDAVEKEPAGDGTGTESVEEVAAANGSIGVTDENIADIRESRAKLADAVAQLALLIPDMAYYFDTPVRTRIAGEIDACISQAARRDDIGVSAITRLEFDSCMDTLLRLADRETRLAELSGDMNGPYTPETLRRELSVAPWQRINYGIGYIDERFSTDCLPPANVMPNPLEWSVLANIMSWLAEHSPELIATTENENRISRMRSIGEEYVQAMKEQAECLANSGTGINDLISRNLIDYEIALRELASGIREAEADFRARRLKPGADVALDKDATQETSYRPDDLVIAPCDQRDVCEMSGSLSATRALIGLYPDEYLVADQTGMGDIEICYRNMEWVQRRSELVRADDENVANYFGYLGFDLVGRYVENDEVTDVFGFRFTGPEEHHYLFAQASEEVLNDSCPVEWVGSKMVTPLREDRGIVPNRLTYLAASRKLPSRLLQNNWDRGAEWRDWFVTGIGVTPLDLPPAPEISTRLSQHLQALYQAGQADIYQRIMLSGTRNSEGEDVSLYDEMSEVSVAKAMLRMQMMLFYPESLYNSDAIRTAIAGDDGLLELRTLRRFREDNVPLTSVNRIARERLFRFREVWASQPESVRRQGSLPSSLVYALSRINFIYRQFFILRTESLREIEVVEETQDQE